MRSAGELLHFSSLHPPKSEYKILDSPAGSCMSMAKSHLWDP